MNRPEGISESAWAAAEQYADELHERDDYMHFESRKVLSRAIQSSVEAERAACADRLMAIAKATPLGHENVQRGKSTYNWLHYAADLVRKGA